MKYIICLMGPTASGKTDLAINLLNKFPFEIISVDSALIYKDMNIGTAKPDNATLSKAPHRLINICDPSEAYSAANFCDDCFKEIEDIHKSNKIPLLVGGTMMYFKSLQQGIATMPEKNKAIRDQILKDAENFGWPHLHNKLKDFDKAAHSRIHPNDTQRIQRALEVYLLSGKSISEFQIDTTPKNSQYKFINIIVSPHDRAILHKRIEMRFDKMLSEGFIDEVKLLFERGDLDSSMPSMRSVGYRQVWDYLSGKCSFDEMREKGVIATRQLAKRQLTWLRSFNDATWFNSVDEDLVKKVTDFLNELPTP